VANDRNEAALMAAIARVLASPEGWRAMAEPAVMARELVATCGALVPSTLTGSDAKTAVHAGLDYDVGLVGGTLPAVKGEKFIAALEHIAKGQV